MSGQNVVDQMWLLIQAIKVVGVYNFSLKICAIKGNALLYS